MVAGYSLSLPSVRLWRTAISSEGAAVYHQDFIECTAADYLKDNYDIIGFDPRGVADSTPVYCGQDSKL